MQAGDGRTELRAPRARIVHPPTPGAPRRTPFPVAMCSLDGRNRVQSGPPPGLLHVWREMRKADANLPLCFFQIFNR